MNVTLISTYCAYTELQARQVRDNCGSRLKGAIKKPISYNDELYQIAAKVILHDMFVGGGQKSKEDLLNEI